MGEYFVASYSGGKDSVLAVYRAIKQGMVPLALITTFNMESSLTWFHGIPENVLDDIAESIGIPVWLIKTNGFDYAENFENTLRLAKESGADVCVFGDIDIEDHIKWCTDRCESVGLTPMFPLYGQERGSVVNEFIDSGFTAYFTIIDTTRIKGDYLGKPLSKEILREIEAQGADICGEGGEYHTFVSDGPCFKKPVKFVFGERVNIDGRIIQPII